MLMEELTLSDRVEAAAVDAAAQDLLANLADLGHALRGLLDLSTRKLAALRTADAAELTRCAAAAPAAIEQMAELTRRRGVILARLAQALRAPRLATAPLSDVAARLAEPSASALRARIVPLREISLRIEQKNRLASDVARRLHSHIREVFADVAKAAQESVVYGPDGQPDPRLAQNWVDAVG